MIFLTLEHIFNSYFLFNDFSCSYTSVNINKMVGLYDSFEKVIVPSAILTQAFATSDLLPEMHQSTILVPALQSQWLMMHKTFIKRVIFFSEIQYMNKKGNMLQSTSPISGDCVISLEFIFLTIGILLGAVLANKAWEIILELGSKGSLCTYYMNHIYNLFTYLNK
ncbi:hypothetical protein Cgig2_008337 [Carnegiea gigantea]|uniref:Cytochrome c assembly protein domain-containing protein n=1 Tax=Carnegiea gigantea TaxID=171969 RepID=A0A9Q1K5L9_9CARY|nr:hypothetical protein Cgig2_008337 [Carnegiea gigantea]